jgi:hypothetical protein
MQQLAEAVHAKQAPHEHALAEERKKKNYREFWAVISLKDPFRLVLSEMRDRLFHTREILHHCLVHPKCAPCPCGTLAEESPGLLSKARILTAVRFCAARFRGVRIL